MPQLAVKVLGVIALDALPAAEAPVDRAPGGEEGRQRSHVGGRRSAAAEARRQPWITGGIEQPLRAGGVQALRDQVKRLVPRDRNETRVLAPPLARIGALHRPQYAVRVVELLHQPECLDAGLAARRMDLGGVEIG